MKDDDETLPSFAIHRNMIYIAILITNLCDEKKYFFGDAHQVSPFFVCCCVNEWVRICYMLCVFISAYMGWHRNIYDIAFDIIYVSAIPKHYNVTHSSIYHFNVTTLRQKLVAILELEWKEISIPFPFHFHGTQFASVCIWASDFGQFYFWMKSVIGTLNTYGMHTKSVFVLDLAIRT